MDFCPDDCEHLNITEKEQNSVRRLGKTYELHFCKKFRQRIIHGRHHPKLIRLGECDGEDG